jgi:hypothetical protein
MCARTWSTAEDATIKTDEQAELFEILDCEQGRIGLAKQRYRMPGCQQAGQTFFD